MRTATTIARWLTPGSPFYMKCFLLVIALVLYPSDTHAQWVCGPGAHFVDTCPAGSDIIANSGAVVGIDTTLNCDPNVSLVLSGPTTIDRAAGTPHSIDTEMVLLNLVGGGVGIWAGQGPSPNSKDLPQSFGSIVEQGGDPFLADSSFDVFFEVNLGGGMFVYNQTALVIEAVIDRIPPPNEYIHPTGCLKLYDAQIGGTHVANLVSARHVLGGPEAFCGNSTVEPGEVCGEPSLPMCPSGKACSNCTCVLAVTLSEFSAVVSAGQIILSWATEAETQNEGFNILRSTDPTRPGKIINSSLIQATGGPAFGRVYDLVDATVTPHTTYYYLLEHIDTSGVRTLHGANACTLNVDPECKPLAVTITPETRIPRNNP
jgi:hypothetical protein